MIPTTAHTPRPYSLRDSIPPLILRPGAMPEGWTDTVRSRTGAERTLRRTDGAVAVYTFRASDLPRSGGGPAWRLERFEEPDGESEATP